MVGAHFCLLIVGARFCLLVAGALVLVGSLQAHVCMLVVCRCTCVCMRPRVFNMIASLITSSVISSMQAVVEPRHLLLWLFLLTWGLSSFLVSSTDAPLHARRLLKSHPDVGAAMAPHFHHFLPAMGLFKMSNQAMYLPPVHCMSTTGSFTGARPEGPSQLRPRVVTTMRDTFEVSFQLRA